jgi:hypothetical protein
MVAPSPTDLEIPGGEAFAPKPKALDQLAGSHVAGLYVRLETMKTMESECSPDDGLQALSHESLTGVRCVSVETQISRLKGTSNDFTQVHETNEFPAIAPPKKIRDDQPTLHPPEVARPGGGRARRIDPWPV